MSFDATDAATALAVQTQSKAITDRPATDAVRFIVRSPEQKRRLALH
jgi:hypothetical protein